MHERESSSHFISHWQRVLRLLDLDRLDAELPELVLLRHGLLGLGLGENRLTQQAQDMAEARCMARGAAAVSMLEMCETLGLLRTIGRLTPDEPFVFDFIRSAANNVDRLRRGERVNLRGHLEHLAKQLAFDPGTSWEELAQAPPFPAGSPEAALCLLARYDWFSRKKRAQVSWYRNRGRLR
ncbi:CHR23 [Symbiodinium natans]|uniref:CHR23 protein n=1 Tax=Symbiodinium natans TaxID=878477 RepID=A0A812RFU6_9DINO|nr:CHR23 [Symbiodinium natans]